MADNHIKDQRSYNMSRIRSNNTKPEKIVRSYLFSKGLRFRKNDKRYPGHPDIVLPKYNTVVFVHGCFWHRHEGCRYATTPTTNVEYWNNKFQMNTSRDKRNQEELKKMGWQVLIIWECQLKKDIRDNSLQKLYYSILKNAE